MSEVTSKFDDTQSGVILVDHGSRREESNQLLLRIVDMFQHETGYRIVEPAHMEIAQPDIATAFDRCVARGAQSIIVFPYFLLPGRHWDRDIPALVEQAAQKHPQVPFLVTAPLGLHPLMAEIIRERIDHCLKFAAGDVAACDVCHGTDKCRIRFA